jgi:hypothetical protein
MAADSVNVVQQTSGIGPRVTQITQMPPDNQKDTLNGAGGNIIGKDQVTVETTSSHQALDAMRRFDSIADDLNITAKNIRETGNGLNDATDLLDRMNGELGKVIKNYPPFSLEDANRKKILMSYASIKKEIDALTVPPPPSPVYEKVKGMWENLFTENDGKITTPALTDSSPYDSVENAANALSSTAKAISSVMSALKASL